MLSSGERTALRISLLRNGFTLIELIIVVVVLVVTFAILMPLLITARERARDVTCRNQLRQIGVGLQTYASLDPAERYCGGSFDWRRDGCPDTHSWLATLRAVTPTTAGGNRTEVAATLLCPSNPELRSAAVVDLLALKEGDGADPLRFDSGMCSSSEGLLSTPPNSEARSKLVEKLVEQGWNTNYAASWHLVRGQPLFTWLRLPGMAQAELFALTEPDPALPGAYRLETTGTLSRRHLDTSNFPGSTVPLLGDANSVAPRSSSKTGAAVEGAGPSAFSVEVEDVVPILGSSSIRLRVVTRFFDHCCFGGTGDKDGQLRTQCLAELGYRGNVYLDTRHWRAIHRGSANLLMADGSVRSFVDQDGDQLLNPGFGEWRSQHVNSRYERALQREIGELEMSTDVFLNTGCWGRECFDN